VVGAGGSRGARGRPSEAIVRRLGTDARWAWAPDGTTAIVDEDVERPSRLVRPGSGRSGSATRSR
jgi:hypothetical protein